VPQPGRQVFQLGGFLPRRLGLFFFSGLFRQPFFFAFLADSLRAALEGLSHQSAILFPPQGNLMDPGAVRELIEAALTI